MPGVADEHVQAAVGGARALTLKPLEEALPLLTAACAQAGVAFVIVRALPDIALSGISRWLSPRKGVIQQSIASFDGTEAEVVAFAADQGIAPGIVVGQLQKAGVLMPA